MELSTRTTHNRTRQMLENGELKLSQLEMQKLLAYALNENVFMEDVEVSSVIQSSTVSKGFTVRFGRPTEPEVENNGN